MPPQRSARYAARDPRVRYCRAEQNRGSSWNFNRVFDLSSREYFMWAALEVITPDLFFQRVCKPQLGWWR